MAQFYIRYKQGDEVLEPELGFVDFEGARQAAREGAKALLSECIKTGRDPTNDAVLILDESGMEVEAIALLGTLGHVIRDRVEHSDRSVATLQNSGVSAWVLFRR